MGLSRRDYFAGLAMQAIISNHGAPREEVVVEDIAKVAVSMADALIEELITRGCKHD